MLCCAVSFQQILSVHAIIAMFIKFNLLKIWIEDVILINTSIVREYCDTLKDKHIQEIHN